MNNAKDAVNDIFDEYELHTKKQKDAALAELNDRIRNMFGIQLASEQLSRETLESMLQNDLTEKETLAGKENLNMFIRYQYVQTIDKKWLDQLEELESLRDAVHLRSYGSKNPLTEYKIDGFNIFDEMMDSIRTTVMSRVFKVRIQLSPAAAEARRRMSSRDMSAQHSEAASFAGGSSGEAQREASVQMSGDAARRAAAGGAMQKHTQGQSVTVRRTMPKIGRNDPCPCGSGKKYKNCHGRNG